MAVWRFELQSYGFKDRDNQPLYYTAMCFAGVAGIEPTSMVLETIILPLNYTPIFLHRAFSQIRTDTHCIRRSCSPVETMKASLSSLPESNQHFLITKQMSSAFERKEHLEQPTGIEPMSYPYQGYVLNQLYYGCVCTP